MSSRECSICYNEYDENQHKPCIGSCGHSICLRCKNMMATSKCPLCNRDDAFSVLTVNYQILEILKTFKELKVDFSSDKSQRRVHPSNLKDDGLCNVCHTKVRKLRICVNCAKDKNYLIEEGGEVKLNTKDFSIEDSMLNASLIALCGDCVLDGEHTGHRVIQFSELKKNIDSLHMQTIIHKLDCVESDGKKKIEDLREKLELAIKNLRDYYKAGEKLNEEDQRKHYYNIEVSLELYRNSVSMIEDASKRFSITANDIKTQEIIVKKNLKPFTEKTVNFANEDPTLIADRKQSVKEPLLIGVFDPKNEVWSSIGRMPTLKSNYAVATLANKIFIVGGMNNGQWLPSLEMYDRDKNLRKEGPRMKRGRTRTSAGIHDKKLYVAGGYDGSYMNSVEIYDIDANEWKDGPALNRPRADSMLLSCNGDLFVVGGFNGKDYEEKIEKLNMEQMVFEEIGEMNGSRAGFGACSFKGRIYIAGGWSSSNNTLKSVRSFDPLSKSWRDETSMTRDRKYFTLHATNEAIYAIRGCADSWTQIAEIEKLNSSTNKWEVISCTTSASQFTMSSSTSNYSSLIEPASIEDSS